MRFVVWMGLLVFGLGSIRRAVCAQGPRATLPSGRQITPAGEWLPTAPYPFSLAVSPSGLQLAVPSVGFPFTLNLAERTAVYAPFGPMHQLPAPVGSSEAKRVFVGVVFSPDGALLFNTTGDTGSVEVRDAKTLAKLYEIPLDVGTWRESFIAAAVLSPEGRWLYVLDQANWRVAVINLEARQVIGSMPTGVNPMALALAPDGKRLYVANSGLFEYSVVPGVDPARTPATVLHFPPFGYPSRAAERGITAEGHYVPGLG